MILLAGPRQEVYGVNGGDVSGRPYYDFSPLRVCREYEKNVMGISVAGGLPSVGLFFANLFPQAQELTDEFGERLLSQFEVAVATDEQYESAEVSARRLNAIILTRQSLETWITDNHGKWVARVWVG